MSRERNPNAGKFVAPDGYKDLGWQKHRGNSIEIHDALYMGYKPRQFDNSTYLNRCTDVIYIIDEAKIFWHIDMSD